MYGVPLGQTISMALLEREAGIIGRAPRGHAE